MSGIGDAIELNERQSLFDQTQQMHMLDQGAQQAAEMRRMQMEQQFQEEQQRRQFQQQNYLQGPGGPISQRQWQDPQTQFGFDREAEAQRKSQATYKFYQDVGQLPQDATDTDIYKLVNQDVSPAAVNSALQGLRLRRTPTQNFLQSPLGQLKGYNFFTSTGDIPDNPLMTAGDAFKNGYVILNDKDAESMRMSKAARENVKGILESGQKILPDQASLAAGTWDPLARWAKTKMGYADYQDFQHAKAGIITYLRSLTNTGRVNAQELGLAVDAFNKANTVEGLQAAYARANKILDADQGSLVKYGRLRLPGVTEPAAAPSAAAGIGPRGVDPRSAGMVPVRIEGGKVIYRGPDGREYVGP